MYVCLNMKRSCKGVFPRVGAWTTPDINLPVTEDA
jgi:hypothetical protein